MRFIFSPRRGFIQDENRSGRSDFDFGDSTFAERGEGSVENIVALTAISDVDEPTGSRRFVQSVKSTFILDKTSTATLKTAVVVATASGTGRWLRSITPHPSWLTGSVWYIDAVNGNDEYLGDTTAAALKTHAELERRWGPSAKLSPPITPGAFAKVLTVNVLSDLPNDDPINIDVTLAPDVAVHYKGGVASTLLTGTFTSVTASSPSTNVGWSFTDSSLPASDTWSSYLGDRVRITSGSRANTVMWVGKDLGSKTMRSSEPTSVTALAGSSAWSFASDAVTRVTPQVGDTYAIERLRKAAIGTFRLKTDGVAATSTFFFGNRFVIGQLALNTSGSSATYLSCDQTTLTSYCCRFYVLVTNCFSYNSMNDCISSNAAANSGGQLFVREGIARVSSGLISAGGAAESFVAMSRSGVLYFDFDAAIEKGQLQGTNVRINSMAIWDTPSTAFAFNGHAVYVGREFTAGTQEQVVPGAGMAMFRMSDSTVRLWGSGAVGVGIYVAPGCTFQYPSGNLPTITGSSGAFLLAGASSARAFDDITGAYTSLRTISWQNLGLPTGSGGFSGNAHNPIKGARLVEQ